MKRLEDLGVIIGFTVRLDPTALGLGIGAYIRIRPAMGELQRVSQLLAGIPEIIECDRVTGEDCFVAKVFVPRVDDLERVIDRLLPFAQTNTSIIQSSPVRAKATSVARLARNRRRHPNRTASPVDGAVSSPSHITWRPRTKVPTGQPVTARPS